MDYTSLKEKSPEELQLMLLEQKEDLRQTRFKVSQGELSTMHNIKKAKKKVAQILTLLSQANSV